MQSVTVSLLLAISGVLVVGKLYRLRTWLKRYLLHKYQLEPCVFAPSQARGSGVGRSNSGARRGDVTSIRPHHEASYGSLGGTPPRQHQGPAEYVIPCTVVQHVLLLPMRQHAHVVLASWPGV